MNPDKYRMLHEDHADARDEEIQRIRSEQINDFHLLNETLKTKGWKEIIEPYIERQKNSYTAEIIMRKGEERIEYIGMLMGVKAFEAYIGAIFQIGSEKIRQSQ